MNAVARAAPHASQIDKDQPVDDDESATIRGGGPATLLSNAVLLGDNSDAGVLGLSNRHLVNCIGSIGSGWSDLGGAPSGRRLQALVASGWTGSSLALSV